MNTERSTSTVDSPTLPDDLSVCHAMIRELIASLHKAQRDCEGVQQRLDLLLRKLYGPKTERFDPNQPWLLPELAPEATPAITESPTEESPDDDNDTAKPKCKGHGRKQLPKDLPR